LGSLGFIASGVVLIGALWAVAALGGMAKNGLEWWAFGLVAAAGGAFVHLQVLSASALFTAVEGETSRRGPASQSEEGD
jgi:hypothetical protein